MHCTSSLKLHIHINLYLSIHNNKPQDPFSSKGRTLCMSYPKSANSFNFPPSSSVPSQVQVNNWKIVQVANTCDFEQNASEYFFYQGYLCTLLLTKCKILLYKQMFFIGQWSYSYSWKAAMIPSFLPQLLQDFDINWKIGPITFTIYCVWTQSINKYFHWSTWSFLLLKRIVH